jgi:hypothetical protein
MSSVLFKDNVVQFRDGKIQFVLAGNDPADCVCCDSLPNCSFCNGPGEGGPFRRLDFTTTISGFPATLDVYAADLNCAVSSITPNRYHVWKFSGLDGVNGTYNWSTTDACTVPNPVFDLTISTVNEIRDNFFPPSNPCTGGTIFRTRTCTTIRVRLGIGLCYVFPVAVAGASACVPYFSATTSGGPCATDSGSSSTIENAPTGSSSFSFTPCSGFSAPTYTFSTAVSGVT